MNPNVQRAVDYISLFDGGNGLGAHEMAENMTHDELMILSATLVTFILKHYRYMGVNAMTYIELLAKDFSDYLDDEQ